MHVCLCAYALVHAHTYSHTHIHKQWMNIFFISIWRKLLKMNISHQHVIIHCLPPLISAETILKHCRLRFLHKIYIWVRKQTRLKILSNYFSACVWIPCILSSHCLCYCRCICWFGSNDTSTNKQTNKQVYTKIGERHKSDKHTRGTAHDLLHLLDELVEEGDQILLGVLLVATLVKIRQRDSFTNVCTQNNNSGGARSSSVSGIRRKNRTALFKLRTQNRFWLSRLLAYSYVPQKYEWALLQKPRNGNTNEVNSKTWNRFEKHVAEEWFWGQRPLFP